MQLRIDLIKKEIGLQSLNDPIDATPAQGRLVFNLFASLAEFKRDLISERTYAGLASEAQEAEGAASQKVSLGST